jgi:hypothetical protein
MRETIQELYEEMRIDARDQANVWDDLDYASGFCDQALDGDGQFLSWHSLPEAVQTKIYERLQPWLDRHGA